MYPSTIVRFLATVGYVVPTPNHGQIMLPSAPLSTNVSQYNIKEDSLIAQNSWAPQPMKSKRTKHSQGIPRSELKSNQEAINKASLQCQMKETSMLE